MSKKLMLFAAGALSALAFAALPTFASAEELQIHCPAAPCIGTIAATQAEHPIILENDNGERLEGTGEVVGTISINAATTTTGTTELEFKHVIELSSGFKFTCNSPGAAAGIVKTGAITTHFINLTTGGTNPGVLLTGINMTMTCAGGISTKTFTGSIIGTVTEHNCNIMSATNKVTFNIIAGKPGTQEHESWTGKTYDLFSGSHASDLTTSAQTGSGAITWQVNNRPVLTCP
jgi:hypothetical protein